MIAETHKPSIPYTPGYRFTPAARLLLRTTWLKTNLGLSVLTALGLHASVVALALAHLWLFRWVPLLGILAYCPVAVLIARQLRGLENLVHEGAHWNWTRRRLLNDVLVDLMAAFPVAGSEKSGTNSSGNSGTTGRRRRR